MLHNFEYRGYMIPVRLKDIIAITYITEIPVEKRITKGSKKASACTSIFHQNKVF